MLSLAAALFTAALALLGKVAFDLWTKHRERRGVAASIAGEIGAFTAIMLAGQSSKNLLAITRLGRAVRIMRLAALPTIPQGTPVFDKVADRVGQLPPHLAENVCAFYNALAGFRVWMSHLHTAEFLAADDGFQCTLLSFLSEQIDKYAGSQALRDSLRGVAEQNFWNFLRARPSGTPPANAAAADPWDWLRRPPGVPPTRP